MTKDTVETERGTIKLVSIWRADIYFYKPVICAMAIVVAVNQGNWSLSIELRLECFVIVA